MNSVRYCIGVVDGAASAIAAIDLQLGTLEVIPVPMGSHKKVRIVDQLQVERLINTWVKDGAVAVYAPSSERFQDSMLFWKGLFLGRITAYPANLKEVDFASSLSEVQTNLGLHWDGTRNIRQGSAAVGLALFAYKLFVKKEDSENDTSSAQSEDNHSLHSQAAL